MKKLLSQKSYYSEKKQSILFLGLILSLGLGIRVYYFPIDIPIVTDGFFSFVYATKTIFEGGLPIGYAVTNTGWSNFLSLFFVFADTTDPLRLMDIQRTLSIVLSTLTVIPAFFIFRKFVDTRWVLFGSFLLVIEPRLLLMSLEGINYSLFFFLFVLTIALFLKRTNISLFLSFVCIACAALVRYEGLLLLIPLSIMYFVKFKDKKSICKFIGLIFVLIIILVPIGILRMQATENYCQESYFGIICGQDGISNKILDGPRFVEKHVISGIPDSDDLIYNVKDKSLLDHFVFLSFTSLGKFLGLALFPFFIFFIGLSLIIFIAKRKFPKLDYEKITILLITCILLLPAIYVYGRGIEEIRYVLVAMPLVCILSVYWTSVISEKITKDKKIIVVLIILVLISSIIFIEYKNRDLTHDRESFLISQEIIKLTDRTNTFDQDGYVKTAILITDWPNIPNPNEVGKLKHDFDKFPTEKYNSIKKFILDFRESGLEYLVVDDDNKMFDEFRQEQKDHPYLIKKFDSNDFDFENHYMIYEIDYELFDDNDE